VTTGVGQNATFTVTASGSAPFTYEWQYSFQTVWYSIAGATQAGYTKSGVQLTDSGLVYQVIVTDVNGLSTISNPATLTVTPAVGAGLPTLNASLPSYSALGDSLSIDNYSASNVSFVWSFQPDASNPYAAPAVFSHALTAASFKSSFKTNSLASYGLQVGSYVVSVYAQDNTDPAKVSNTVTQKMVLMTMVETDLSAVRVYPNPWRQDKHATKPIVFDQLPLGATVKIFTVSGQLVRSLTPALDKATWDLKSDSSDAVASGLYIYLITVGDTGYGGNAQKTRGKLAIIR
jgi:hypothetical protein